MLAFPIRTFLALPFVLAALTPAVAQGGPTLLATSSALPKPSAPGATMLITGRVESVTGPLVGAVVGVVGKAYQKTVTNGNGEFRLTVPATTEPLKVQASYAGFKDVAATVTPGSAPVPLRLTEVQQTPELPRKLQLKRYVKIAQKEARRESRQLHRD